MTVLDAIRVYGEAPQTPEQRQFLRRRRIRQGYSFNLEDIKRTYATNVSDVLSTVPGFRVLGNGRNRFVTLNARRCPPKVYFDGLPAGTGMMFSINEFPINWVYGIEAFTSGQEVPAKYRDVSGSRCGVILIWTTSIR